MMNTITELPRRFPYNPSWRVLLACVLFFGACAAFMGYKATHNSVGLIINGIITLGPTGATIFYWVVAALAGMFVLAALLMAIRRLGSHKVLELGTDALLLPHGFLQIKISRIPYVDIQGVSETQVSGQKFLYVRAAGHRFTITASLFPDTDSYLAVRDFLTSRARP
jgi:hypothetical protein